MLSYLILLSRCKHQIVLVCFSNTSVTLAFVGDGAKGGIFSLNGPSELGKSGVCLIGQKYFKKFIAMVTCAHTIFLH